MSLRRLFSGALVAVSMLWAAEAQSAEPADPSLAGFPPGYFLSCADAPSGAVVVVPERFRPYMRVLCTKAGAALAPVSGERWVFANGASMFLTALNPRSAAVSGTDAFFTRLADAPLTPTEVAAFRERLKPVVKNPAILQAEILRLVVDSSTADHKQEYLLLGRATGGRVVQVWGIECYQDCDPMEQHPWAFTVVPDKNAAPNGG
jgi:hypothetical protein